MKEKVLVITANLGGFDDGKIAHHPQDTNRYDVSLLRFTDDNFPPRMNALHPRLQAKIPKMLGWEYYPNYDYYLWLDGAVRMTSPDCINFFIESLGCADFAIPHHPDRRTISDELAYMKNLMNLGSIYLNGRYKNEAMTEQVQKYLSDTTFRDKKLYQATYFCYTNYLTKSKPGFFRDWFFDCARYSVQDQLSLPYFLNKHEIKTAQIDLAQAVLKIEHRGQFRTRPA
jgi:hypothetical protein